MAVSHPAWSAENHVTKGNKSNVLCSCFHPLCRN